jgi:hypothetical protein
MLVRFSVKCFVEGFEQLSPETVAMLGDLYGLVGEQGLRAQLMSETPDCVECGLPLLKALGQELSIDIALLTDALTVVLDGPYSTASTKTDAAFALILAANACTNDSPMFVAIASVITTADSLPEVLKRFAPAELVHFEQFLVQSATCGLDVSEFFQDWDE